jgi:hypothetical protein
LSALAAGIDRAKIAAFEQNEAALASALTAGVGRYALDETTKRTVAPFVEWCNRNVVRYCAAKPATVAAFVFEYHKIGASDDALMSVLEAIGKLHDAYQLANPVATDPVVRALDRTLKTEPPRSWPRDDKARFSQLPKAIQLVIERRERERDKWLRQTQAAAANEKKKPSNTEAKKTDEGGKAKTAAA